ncbi:MAG: hypothetical protein L6R42_006424 [Xanthoria sp. 1 TBL-2021]|nr:MAG: hypothetical protein L6R42_006424 [Xanthoria sp. 1 TBL-2021]
MTSENLPLVVAKAESRTAIVNAAVCDAVNSRAPDSSQMQPGRVYIGRLPNHNGPVFVRKRRKSFANPFGIPSVTSVYGAQQYPPDYQCTTTAVYQPPAPSYVMPAPPPQMVQLPPPTESSTTTVTTTVEPQPQHGPSKHSCASCGKFRSARYHYRHPLAPGETPRPTLCRKCVKQHTSSEEFDDTERARWKQRQREGRRPKHHRSYSSDEWSSSSSQEERRRHHRYRSSNESRRHRRSTQSSSGRSTKIFIIRRTEARRQQPSSSSDNVRITRRVRTDNDRPRPILRKRHRYGPYDGHYSHEEYREDVEIDDDDYFQPRGRSRSRTFGRQSHDGSYEDEYVRVSTSTSRSKPLSLFDRLTGSRSRSRSRASNSYEDERVRITIRSREPSPLHYERHEEEYEERVEESHRPPWRRGSESMHVHHGSEIETRGLDFFGRPHSSSSRHTYEDRRLEKRSSGRRSPGRFTRSLRGHSPEPILRRRSSMDHGLGHRPRVRFARSTSSHREEHQDSHSNQRPRRRYRPGSDLSVSDEEEFRSAESRLREHGYRYVRASTPSPVRYESRRRSITHESHHDDEGFGRMFDRSYLTPPIESHSYVRRRSHSREHSDPYHGGESYESRKRVRIIDV